MALQQRHSDERVALLAKFKAQRTEALKKSGKDNGAERNALDSLLALVQAAEKLELQARQRNEKKALQATYKPLPVYKEWSSQPQIVGLHVLPASEQRPAPSTSPVASTLRFLTSTKDARRHTTYQLFRKDVFRDEGRMIVILDLNSDAGIAAALALGQEKFGNVLTLTGPAAFQLNAVALAVANGLTCRFADPALEDLRERLQAEKYQAERLPTLTLEKAREPILAPSKPLVQRDIAPAARAQPAAQGLPLAADPATALAEAHRLEQEEKAVAVAEAQAEAEQAAQAWAAQAQKVADADHAAEENRLSEPVQLADIERQIAQTKAEAAPNSLIHGKPVVQATEEDHAKAIDGEILASNETFVAISIGKQIKIYQMQALAKPPVVYDGIALGHDRFAKGNHVQIKQTRSGASTVVSEKREALQTEETKQRALDKGLGR